MPAKPKCCSARSVKLQKANFAKASKAANGPTAPDGRFAAKVSKKKASGKKAPAKKSKGCSVCGK